MAISVAHPPTLLAIRDALPNPMRQRRQRETEVEAEHILEDARRGEAVHLLLLARPHPNPRRREATTPQPRLTAMVGVREAEHVASVYTRRVCKQTVFTVYRSVFTVYQTVNSFTKQ